MSPRDAVLLAAARELREACDEGAEFVLPPEAAGDLAEILVWVTGATDVRPIGGVGETAKCKVPRLLVECEVDIAGRPL